MLLRRELYRTLSFSLYPLRCSYAQVAFNGDAISLNKEVRNLRALGYRVPLMVVNKGLTANHLYPYCISLRASLRTYEQTLAKVQSRNKLVPLIASYHLGIQEFLAKQAFPLPWVSYRLEKTVQELTQKVCRGGVDRGDCWPNPMLIVALARCLAFRSPCSRTRWTA